MQEDLVYDIGVNNGDDTDYYLREGYRVLGIEANPDLHRLLEERFANEIRAGRCRFLNVAIGAENGIVEFYLSKGNRGVWSSLDSRVASREGIAVEAVQVPCRRFRDVVKEFGTPFYLKVDIEGADHYCLKDIDPADPPRYVSFEASENSVADLLLLANLGYDRFKLIDQLDFRQAIPPPVDSLQLAYQITKARVRKALGNVPALPSFYRGLRRIPRRGGSGQATGAPAFPVSSSGPMGEATDGEWKALEEVVYAWVYYVNREGRSNWYDVHAKHRDR